MKRCLIAVLLFCAVFPLFSQARNIPLYVPPVDGIGKNPEDNDKFTDLLIRELRAWNFKIMNLPGAADYALISMLSWYDEDEDGVEEYSLLLTLIDRYGNILYEQSLVYKEDEEVNIYLPSMLTSMLTQVFVMYLAEEETIVDEEPEEVIDPDEWRTKEWLLGTSVFWSPRVYQGSFISANLANFGIGFSAEYNFNRFAEGKLEFLKYFSAGTGLEVVPDWVIATLKPGDEYRNTILQIPIRIHYIWRHGDLFMHEPYVGVHFNIPLFRETTPAIASWHTGFQFGIKAGPGIAYADIRYSMDFGQSGLHMDRPNDTRRYDRYMFYLGIGYKYDLVGMILKLIPPRPPKEADVSASEFDISPALPDTEEEPFNDGE